MENNNLDEKEPNKSGKTKTIVLVMILLILMLGIGIFVGMYISKDGNTVENKTQENINGDSNKQSNEIAKDENDVNEVNTTGNNSTTDDESKTENTISDKTEETDKTEKTDKTEEKDNSEENKTDDYKLNVNGSYKYEEQTDNYYHRSDIVITNQTDTSINFSINAAHGNDVDHVNVGDVSGIAKKIDIPTDYIYPESEQIAYQYTENIDGNVNKITLVCTAHGMFQYIQVIEEYPSGVNPYAGNRVFFSGEYDKVN